LLRWNNPSGIGDNLDLRLLVSNGAGTTVGRLGYEAPIGASAWRGGLGYSRVGYELGEQFEDAGFTGKADQLASPARVAVPGGGIVIESAVSVVPDLDDATATFRGAPGAVVRLLSGRLRPEHADGVSVEGNVSLDDLRRVFPGF
jgi:hypothetical protein